MNSILSDLPDAGADYSSRYRESTDFAEGMDMIYDALHPYVDEDSDEDLTMPITTTTYKGRNNNGLSSFRRGNGASPRISNDGRQ